MSDSIEFKQKDPRGYEVWLSSERYSEHIIRESGHTEIEIEDIQKAIAKPKYIYKGTNPNSLEYFGWSCKKYPKLMPHVSVAEYEDHGDIRTAFPVKKVGGSIIPFEEGGCIYVGISNKL